ncbi:23075_t:CDS:2 [Rhizophagus irregularis]|nr:23075_t:CDS:2 [Rhizophagus irregularis]
MQRFPNAFKPILDKYIKYDCKVFKLKNENNGKIRVYWKEKHGIEKKPGKVYDSPFGVVRQWELPDKLDRNDDIDYIRRRAIRELNYDNSAKIFLKFKSRFWEKDSRPIAGGSSSTDLPIRTMIYPSYYKDDQGNPDEDGPAILLGSYTWANDAAKYSPYPQKENPNDPTTVGAFALFGLKQFEDLLYPIITVTVVKEVLLQSGIKDKWGELLKHKLLEH